MIRHNFPTKAMDYLRSGRRILVHAPADSYLTWLAKQEGFALVVDRPDIKELAAAIDRLAADCDLQEKLVSNALAFVRTRESRSLGREALGCTVSIACELVREVKE